MTRCRPLSRLQKKAATVVLKPTVPWYDGPALAARCTAFLRPALRRADCRVGPKERLLFLLGGGGAVARVPSLLASCAPLLTPLCASRSSFLTPFSAPRSPFLTPLGTRLRGIRGRRRGRGGRRGGLGFSLRHRQNCQRSESKNSRVSKESECAATTDLFRLRTFTHFQAPGFQPWSMSLYVERLALDPNQPGHAGITALRMPS